MKRFKVLSMSQMSGRQAIAGLGLVVLAFAAMVPLQASADSSTVRFGTPTWPGVTVKTEVGSQLVQAMGYKTRIMSASPAFIISGLKSDNIDVYFGGWMPTEKDMIMPADKKGEVKVLTKNITGAVMGLAVPKYVWDAGVHSEADLNKYADKFDHKIYGIEPGSGFNKAIQKAIDDNRDDLGKWKLVATSTSVMLSQVKRAIPDKKWIVFLGWEPHWMNIVYDIKYLKAVGKPTIADTRSNVLTVINPKLAKRHPEITKLLKQMVVDKKIQSKWIYNYSKKEEKKTKVARNWISNNLDTVAKWMKDVKAKNGKPAIDVIKEKFKSDSDS